jgi:hypothetical protein
MARGVERPCSVGTLSERVEAQGAAGYTTWTPVVGWQTRRAGRVGSAVYPSFARLGSRRLPQSVQVEMTSRRVGGTLSVFWRREPEKLSIVERKRMKTRGGQNYLGAKVRRR